jgi:type I restriction enzyme M protein
VKLTEQIAAKYPKLTDDEIKSVVVEDKWMGALADAVHGELDRVSQTLTGRIRQLAERYANPLPQLEDQVDALAERVLPASAREAAASPSHQASAVVASTA